MKDWQGVFPSITTKFDARDHIDVPEMEHCIAMQLDAGVHGLILAAPIGEAHMLDMLEKIEVLKAARRVVAGKIPVLMTISNSSTREACLFAEASASYGADGLMVMLDGPFLPDPSEIEAHCRAVARASDLPLMILNNPADYGTDLSPELLARFADEPLVRAVADASGDVRRITRIINLTGARYELFAGADSLAFESLILGASGWAAAIAATFPKETVAIWRYAIAGHVEEARRIYRWFQPLLDLGNPPKQIQKVKLVERMVNGSSERCRLPRQPLSGEMREAVEKTVRYALAARAGILVHPPAAE
ncbi:MAG TPA: dihydrodipicolinate synthase family protein [Aestuariivirgaceae bacterium]|jgi:4-hydroxy-tetrahydrodipicolinate synthase